MTKPATFITIITLIILLSACSTGEQNKEMDLLMNMDDMAVITVDGEFGEIIANNPIDIEFIWESEGSSSEARIMMAADYISQWEAEIEHALDILEEYLFEENYCSRLLAYENWKQYREKTISIEQNIFYVGGNYQNVTEELIGCSDTYPQVMEVHTMKTKEYEVELLSIEYAFIGKIEWAKTQQ